MTQWQVKKTIGLGSNKKNCLKMVWNNIAFVFTRHQQHGFCFVLVSNKVFFHVLPTTRLSNLTIAGKTRRGRAELHTPGSSQSSLNENTQWITDRQDKATIRLGCDKNTIRDGNSAALYATLTLLALLTLPTLLTKNPTTLLTLLSAWYGRDGESTRK